MTRSALLLAALLCACRVAGGDPVAPLEPSALTADGLAFPGDGFPVPSRMMRLDRARIERSGAATLPELLRREADVDLLDIAGDDRTLGTAAHATLRILWDGLPIDPAGAGAIPLAALDAVEIRRDSAAECLILLVPRRSTGLPALDATARGATAGDRGAALAAGARLAGWDAALTLAGDDGRIEHGAGGWRERRAVARLGRGAAGRAFTLDAAWHDDTHPRPGAFTRSERDARGSRAAPLIRPDFADSRGFRILARFTASRADHASRFTLHHAIDRDAALLTGRAASTPGGRGEWRAERREATGAEAAWRWTPRPDFGLEAGLDWRRETLGLQARSRDATGAPATAPGASDDRVADFGGRRETGAVLARASWRPVAPLTIETAVRAGRITTAGGDALRACAPNGAPGGRCREARSATGWRTGVVWVPRDGWELFAAAGNGFTMPAFEAPATAPGIDGLRAGVVEHRRRVSAGVRARFVRIGGELSYRESRDRFGRESLAPGAGAPSGGARLRALDGSAWWQPLEEVEVRVSCAGLSARYAADALLETPGGPVLLAGRRLPLAPRARYAAAFRIFPAPHTTLSVTWRSRSRSVLAGDETNQRAGAGIFVPASHRWDAGARWDGARIALDLRLDNVTGNRDETFGRTDGVLDEFIPVPPASVRLAVTLKLP